MISLADTYKMETIAKEVAKATNDLEDEVNSLYKRLRNVPRGTGEWFGNQADYYFSVIAQDKRQYTALISRLRRFSAEINSAASSIRATIKQNNNES